jgi:hypothetical protein
MKDDPMTALRAGEAPSAQPIIGAQRHHLS